MTIVTRQSRVPRVALMPEMNQLFSSFFDDAWNTFWPATAAAEHPANIWEEGDTLLLEMELPAVRPEALDLSIAGNELTIAVRVEHEQEPEQKRPRYLRRERRTAGFQRTFQFPTDIEPDHVEASLDDGVLTVRMAKAESAKPRRITVTSGK